MAKKKTFVPSIVPTEVNNNENKDNCPEHKRPDEVRNIGKGNPGSASNGATPEKQTQIIDLSSFEEVQRLVDTIGDDGQPYQAFAQIKAFIDSRAEMILGSDYRVVFLYDMHNLITDHAADRIFSSIQQCQDRNLLLILHSGGGMIEPAYLISKCCKELCKKFIVCVPRRAKSAATLLALGAAEIHMGYMSELGPIDPQFDGLPALALASAVKTIASVLTEYPAASEMFSKYLVSQLPLGILGYFERIADSAAQYAERLLAGHPHAREIAHKLVHEYKAHRFVIDRRESIEILGQKIKTETKEYQFGREMHQVFEMLNLLLEIKKKGLYSFVGAESYHMMLNRRQPDAEGKR